MTGRLEGKRAIVTGAGAGIGRGVALKFAEEGASVAALDVRLETGHRVAGPEFPIGKCRGRENA